MMLRSIRSLTTRAAVCESLSAPVVVRDDWEIEGLGPTGVLVETRAAGLNFGEVLQLEGKYQEKLEPPFVPGNEMSGVVAAVGSDVKLRVGDAVIGLPRGGAWAAHCALDQRQLIPLGGGPVDFNKAAALAVTYGTAYLGLKHRAAVQPGETVLVTAAAGGVGLAAVQVAKSLGARVIAAAGSSAKVDLAMSRGADHGLVYDDPKTFKDDLKRLGGHDVAVDMVGGPLFEAIVRSTKFDGRCLVVGFASGDVPKIPCNLLLVKNISLVGLYWGAHAKVRPQLFHETASDVVANFRDGSFDPHLGAVFPLSRANDAVNALKGRASSGKVVLDMSS